MKLSDTFRFNFSYVVALLHIALFTYAAVSKVLEFQKFQIQIGQSPLLSAFAGPVSYGVVIVEIGLSVLLMLPKYRLTGLYGSFVIMTMFSAYIFIMLNFSYFIPCSCGGILQKMNWTEHLLFNLFFVILSGFAIVLFSKNRIVYGYLTISFISAASSITVLFLLSEDIIKHRNTFVRRIPDQVRKTYDTDLKFNSYYFAGTSNGKIYLGNVTAPLLLTEIDTTLKTRKEILVQIDNKDLSFRALKLIVQEQYFFVTDGTIPCLFRGTTGKWHAALIPIKSDPFANPVFIDSTSIAYRTHDTDGKNILGITEFGANKKSFINPLLLQKQIDGIFDVDGTLMMDKQTHTIIYLYYYRNQYIVADPKLNLKFRGNTIDTVSRAQIKIAHNTDNDERSLAAPPLMVNKSAYAYKGLLFVNSNLIGKFEDASMWDQARLIDIYALKDKAYVSSFYVYNIDKLKLRHFIVYNNHFYALVGTHLVSYKLSDLIIERFSTSKNY